MTTVPALLTPPGPRGSLIYGNLRQFAPDKLGFFLRCAREYGDVVAIRLGPIRAVLVSHPDAIEDILVTHSYRFRKHFALRMNSLLLGKGLLTSEGDFWLRQRRLAQPAFTKARIATYAPDMVLFAERLLAGWVDGETVDVAAEMGKLTLQIAAKTLFGGDVEAEAREVGAALAETMASFDARINSWFPLPRWVPTPRNLRVKQAVRRLDEILYRFIAERRRSGEERDDLLSLLLHAQDEAGGRMTDKQLRDEAMTIFLAGHETTALALAWTWLLLSEHPEVEGKLHAELASVLGGRNPTVADLARLPYLERVLLESMRVYPPVYAIGREALEDITIGGYRIPRGRTIFLSQWVVHRDGRWYDRPEDFDPDRWADGLIDRIPRYAYFPFGGGPRLCIGNNFAMMEAALVLATAAQKWRLRLVPGHPIEPWATVTLRPRHGIKMTLHRRGAGSPPPNPERQ